MHRIYLPLLFFIGLIGLWQASFIFYPHLNLILASPLDIASILLEKKERFMHHTFVTFQEMAIGGMLAFVVAFPFAWVMSVRPTARHMLQPLFLVIQCLPMFALAPIMIIWLGWSKFAIILPTALMIFFPLTMTLYKGLVATPEYLKEFFQVQGASPFQTFVKLQLPWSMPFIFSGLRIAGSIAGVGAVAGEWAGGQEGLGILMLESRRGADLPMTFAALFCLMLLSLSLYGLIAFTERLMKKERQIAKLALATTIMIFAIFIACLGPEKEPKTRLVLDWLPNPNHVPLYVGVKMGFFKQAGVHLDLMKVHDAADNLPYLAHDQADYVISYASHTLRAKERGAKIRPVAILVQEPLNSIIYLKNQEITHPKDLNMKRVGYCIDGSSTKYLKKLLEQNKIYPEEMKNVTFDLVSTLGTHQVDAVYGAYWNIEGEFLRSYGIDVGHFSVKDLGVPSCYELIIVAKEEIASEKVAKFQKALQESIDWCRLHPEEAFSHYASFHPDKGDKTIAWEKNAWLKTVDVLAKTQEIEQAQFDRFASWLRESNLM